MKSALVNFNADIYDIIEDTPDSVKSTAQPNKDLPRWLKLWQKRLKMHKLSD